MSKSRKETFSFSLSPEPVQLLREVAERRGVSASQILDRLLKKWAERQDKPTSDK